MKEYPLTFKDGHLLVELEGGPWVYDTGEDEEKCHGFE